MNMSWIIYSLIAILIVGSSDIFRKLASGLKDPFFTNLIFQFASFSTAFILFMVFSRRSENNPRDIFYAVLGGMTISLFSLFSFKALSTGPDVSTVIPVLRIGGIAFLVILGVLILKDQLTIQKIAGLLFSLIGIYLLYTNK